MRIISKNIKDTQRLAVKIAKDILASPHRKHAAVIGLVGDLGAGKTTFAQAFARGLGIKKRILSPTFVIFRRYILPLLFPRRARPKPLAKVGKRESRGAYTSFYHVDAYRISNSKELVALGFKKILADPKNIVLIEWADNVKKLLPKDALLIRMKHGKTAGERILTNI